jgi:DeoR/GlpR family transcriptional regulator of sugar metabolism
MPARKQTTDLPNEIKLQQIVSLKKAAELQGTSVDTIRRQQANKIIRISPRRLGIRVCDALKLVA